MSESVSIVGEYFRSTSGEVIHLAPCSYMGKAMRWTYADGRSLRSIAAEVNATSWMRLCRRCWPAGAFTEGVTAPVRDDEANLRDIIAADRARNFGIGDPRG